MNEQPDDLQQRCRATRLSHTANGDVVVLCNLPYDHLGQHEGRVGAFDIRWPRHHRAYRRPR